MNAINLDTYSRQELEEFLAKAEENKQAFGLELFPHKPPGFMRALNQYINYSKELLEYMNHVQYNRTNRIKNSHERLVKIYSTIPEDFRWTEED